MSEHKEKDDYLPSNCFVTSMLTDMYQLTMTYAYWKGGRSDDVAVFDLLFRKNPFGGEYTIFAGLDECLRYVNVFGFSDTDVSNLRALFPEWEEKFWDYLLALDTSKIKVYAMREGAVAFPKVPMIRVEGPLGVAQLLETTFLCLVNFPSLVATNAARHRIAAGPTKKLSEFGLRRAQGPDGAMSASRYAYLGGFDATSNLAAGIKNDILLRGTHAHSFVSSYIGLHELNTKLLRRANSDEEVDFVDLCQNQLKLLKASRCNTGELAAFIAYAQAYPKGFLALVDTYDTLSSGVPNFLAVSLALNKLGYQPVGIRLDSGDLAYLSRECRKQFIQVSKAFSVPFEKLTIVASNDLNEEVLYSLRDQGHEIDSFGIGTHLVTCQRQPALGCVYKLVEINGSPRIKVSQDIVKVTIPGRKKPFRLYGRANQPVLDLLVLAGSPDPVVGERILCRHPFDSQKRVYISPQRVEPLHTLVWDGKSVPPLYSLQQCKEYCASQLKAVRSDHIRRLNPTPYKVSVTLELFTFLNDLWQSEVPIPEID
uniref:Nicotinate phosphoribosyltransferase n=2 Tax=Hirondellea gigas TaxID=1518452 RepID=A0A6A7GAJ7_9CRUS